MPITDELCWVYCYTWNPDRPLTEDEHRQYRAGRTVHARVDERWVPIRNRDNDYLIDRDVQKRKTFTRAILRHTGLDVAEFIELL